MFKKSADLIHLHDRAGTHATKGRATGRVDLRKRDHTDFDIRQEAQQLRLARRELHGRINRLNIDLDPILDAFIAAGLVGDIATANTLRPVVKRMRDELHRLQKQKRRVAKQIRLLPSLTE